MKAAIVYKTDGLVRRVERYLSSLDVETVSYTQPSEELEKFDFIVSIGGDGTVLRILQKLRHCPPIFGINTGRIGLLTHANPENFEAALRDAVEEFDTESFPRIKCSAERELLALNEIAVLNRQPAKLIDVKVKIDGVEVEKIRCDGFVIATQIGSTGYAFSAGGPVVEPYLDCLILIPLAPFRFGWKPYVVGLDREVEISAENAIIVADGQKKLDFDGTTVIEKSEFPAVFFRKEDRLRNLFDKVKDIS